MYLLAFNFILLSFIYIITLLHYYMMITFSYMIRLIIFYYIIYIFIIIIYSRSSVTQHADNSTLPITQHPQNIWLDSYLLHVNKNPITQQI